MPAALRYPGAKWSVADWIIGLMPPHKSYLEPFFGSGAVFIGTELVARGVEIEAQSVADPDGISLHIFCYNVQPGIEIDYLTGESRPITN